jgi:DNA-binding response OmpR family regulator
VTETTPSILNSQKARILIVEDEPIIAYTLEELLVEYGFDVVGVALRLGAALDIITMGNCDAAILDVNLAGTSSAPAAVALTALGIPFIVVSSYSLQQPGIAFSRAHWLQKPCDIDHLVHLLRGLLVAPSQL